jgi:aspartate racemase
MVKTEKPVKKTIGILGGMGPETTVYLFDLIVKKTRAAKDGDHIPLIIMNNPEIPDRTAAIFGEGNTPLPLLSKIARDLEKAGADFLVMPCVTAHYYYPDIIKQIKIPFIHMIQETANHLTRQFPEFNRFGLLATNGTLKTSLFQQELEKIKSEVVMPDSGQQKKVMETIYGKEGIKAGFKKSPRILLSQIAEQLKQNGAQAIIAGCTEIGLVIEDLDINIPKIKPLHILASASIKMAGYTER